MKIVKIRGHIHSMMKASAAIKGKTLQDCIENACLDWLEKVKTDKTNPENGNVSSKDIERK